MCGARHPSKAIVSGRTTGLSANLVLRLSGGSASRSRLPERIGLTISGRDLDGKPPTQDFLPAHVDAVVLPAHGSTTA
jgi:hypothetical protein